MLGLSDNNVSLLITCLTVIIVVAVTHGKGVTLKSDDTELAITSDKEDNTKSKENNNINEKK